MPDPAPALAGLGFSRPIAARSSLAKMVGAGTTRREIVVAASFRIWPGWRRRRPPDSRAAIWWSGPELASGGMDCFATLAMTA